MKRTELRALAMERAGGRCEFPTCNNTGLEMAHLKGSGMGGSKFRDVPENVTMLCTLHHDLLDGRITANVRRFEMEILYRAVLGRQWPGRR